ncbi:hypothetical protein DLM75_17320 [Leptospira stimsonii]|uniref:Uncharacterized protein n=1 Tax=Leptospira stimsonii TaxID=2202203 RepID=A0A396YXF4_9LEPT|nr:hypothetical protein DLM75_17320 [Leptospira stimsonii]
MTTDFLLQGEISFSNFFWYLSLNAFHVSKLIRFQQCDRGGVVFKLRILVFLKGYSTRFSNSGEENRIHFSITSFCGEDHHRF